MSSHPPLPPRAQALFDDVDAALEAGEAERALSLARELEVLLPDEPEVALLIADCLRMQGDDEGVLRVLERAHQRHPRELPILWELADALIGAVGGEQRVEDGCSLAQRGLELARKAEDVEFELDFLVLEASAHTALGDPRKALAVAEAARALNPVDERARLEHAGALFELARFEEAKALLEALLADLPDEPWAHHTLGLIAERARDEETARAHFARARAIDPETFPAPIELGEEAFDAALEAAIERLPKEARKALENTPIAVEDFPSTEDLIGAEPPLSPTILGLFRGLPIPHRELLSPADHFPATVLLYQRNLERFARSEEELIHEIEVTLLHEVGHLLGLDEDDLTHRGLH